MCLICIEFQKDKLTIPEARCNLKEMREGIGEEHANEVDKMLEARAKEELEELFRNFDPFISPPTLDEDTKDHPFQDESLELDWDLNNTDWFDTHVYSQED